MSDSRLEDQVVTAVELICRILFSELVLSAGNWPENLFLGHVEGQIVPYASAALLADLTVRLLARSQQ